MACTLPVSSPVIGDGVLLLLYCRSLALLLAEWRGRRRVTVMPCASWYARAAHARELRELGRGLHWQLMASDGGELQVLSTRVPLPVIIYLYPGTRVRVRALIGRVSPCRCRPHCPPALRSQAPQTKPSPPTPRTQAKNMSYTTTTTVTHPDVHAAPPPAPRGGVARPPHAVATGALLASKQTLPPDRSTPRVRHD